MDIPKYLIEDFQFLAEEVESISFEKKLIELMQDYVFEWEEIFKQRLKGFLKRKNPGGRLFRSTSIKIVPINSFCIKPILSIAFHLVLS